MSASRWEQYKEKNGTTLLDLFNVRTKYATEELAAERYTICQNCEEMTITKNCKQCGCFMVVKTKLQESKCPLGKW
jgi:hypothetical protein